MSVSMRDIAEEVGVSVQVVSKVLHGGRSTVGASQATRQRVTDAAKRLGYRPNAASLALRRQHFASVGVLIGGPDEDIFMPQKVLAGLCDELSTRGYTCSLVTAGRLDADNIEAPRLLREQMVDALIISYSAAPTAALLQSVDSMTIPVIWLYRELQHNAVEFDESDAGEKVLAHLAAGGHQRVTFVDFNAAVDRSLHLRQRLTGAYAAAKRLGVTIDTHVQTRVERPDRAAYIQTWLQKKPRPEAVIVDSCSGALTMLNVATQMGIDVPNELAIATFDDGTRITASHPTLTAAVLPHTLMGKTAAEMALQLTQGRQKKVAARRLQCDLYQGGSTRTPDEQSAINTHG